ncbi:MAG: spermidine synthase, partial [Chthoniobacterales bacterium]
MNSVRVRIFVLSCTLLFFELLCIRWIPAYVRYLSYFTNFILFASFLGIGLGILSARRPQFRFPSFPVLFLALTIVVAVNRFELHLASTDVLYFGSGAKGFARAESFVLLPLIFTFVAAAFVPLARSLGTLFREVAPLTAYTYDILGSLAGTAAFFFLSYFSLAPICWFTILGGLVLLLATRANLLRAGLLLGASAAIALFLQHGTYWSPYYKITLTPAK